jgi:hypothetical protein
MPTIVGEMPRWAAHRGNTVMIEDCPVVTPMK